MTELTPPAAELHGLISLFYGDPSALGEFDEQDAEDCPIPYQQMLAHEAHMTVTVERRHGCSVDVEVLETAHEPKHYLRKILLRRQTDRRVVQFGIVRLALDPLDSQVRDEILSQRIPLGRVLIEHDVMRHVQLNALWRVTCGSDLAGYFEVDCGHVTYGRTALIYCNGEPAVELLEIVAPEDTFSAKSRIPGCYPFSRVTVTEQHVQIFSCGGTIDKIYFDAKSEYEVGEPQIETVFRDANVGFTYSIESVLRKDSLDMDDADRQLIRDKVSGCGSRFVLITHGTDTMPDTARFLQGIADKVIVLTGSMTPARFQKSDAEFNVGCAVGALFSCNPGVYIAMNGCVFPADRVRKNRQAGRFELIAEPNHLGPERARG